MEWKEELAMHAHYTRSSFETPAEDGAVPRLALGGGFDQTPPEQGETSAEIIRFPLERVRPEAAESPAPAEDADAPPAGAMWGAWLNSVLSSDPIAGLRAER